MLDDIIVPEGWSKEIYCGIDTTVVLSTPEACHVTIDFKSRWWSLGFGISHLSSGFSFNSRGIKYTGRTWKKDIVRDAIEALQKV